MINRKNAVRESGQSKLFALTFTAIVTLAALMMGTAAMLTPEAANSNVATQSVAAYDVPTAYFPAQYVNQATEIEPMPPTF
jgi:hypothetical protein